MRSFLISWSSAPSFRRRSMKSDVATFRAAQKVNNADLAGNAGQGGADNGLVLFALLVIVAEKEDAPVLEPIATAPATSGLRLRGW